MDKTNSAGITIYGAGGHSRVIIDILESKGIPIARVVDDAPNGDSFMGYPLSKPGRILGSVNIAIGNCNVRKRIAEKIEAESFPVIMHPTATVARNVTIGEGSVIVHGAIVQSSARIGKHCIINTRSVVEHDCVIHDFVHIASGAVICGGVEIGECSWIGAGAVVRQGIRIGSNCMIGAGSVVVKDIPDNAVAYGNPCRVVKPKKQ